MVILPTDDTVDLSNATTFSNDAINITKPTEVQDRFLPVPSPQMPLPKQFIPVIILAMFLLILFVSYLLRYPRILYISPSLVSSSQDGSQDQRNVIHPSEKVDVCRPSSFLGFSFFRPRGVSATALCNMTTLHPTVRLVRGEKFQSPDPCTHLSDTPSYSSPTLVGSLSPVSLLDVEANVTSPKLTLPEVFDDGFLSHQKQEDACTLQKDGCSLSTPIGIVDMTLEAQTAKLSSSPPTPSFSGLYDLPDNCSVLSVSPVEDVQHLPAFDAQMPENAIQSFQVSPELTLPPAALVHPIVIRRALTPWHRRSLLESRYSTISTVSAKSELDQSHRPCVPSRLRYFTSLSRSSSQTHLNSEFSPGQPWGSSKLCHHNLNEHSDHISSFSHAESDADSTQNPPHFATIPLETAHISPSPRQSAVPNAQLMLKDAEINILSECRQDVDRPSFFEPLSPLGSIDESQGQSTRNEEGATQGSTESVQDKRVSAWFPDRETRRASAAYRTLLGLGLRAISNPLSDRSPRPAAFRSSVAISDSSPLDRATVAQKEHGHDFQNPPDRLALAGQGLRGTLSRLLALGRDGRQMDHGPKSFDLGNGSADQSVEIMFMSRQAGLDGT